MDLYGAVVAEARRPEFFTDYGVDDTPEGRTSMIILLAFPVLERLQAGDKRDRRLARLLTETFITDVDDCLREMGVGDLSVPKKVKRAAQALGERCLAYRAAVNAAEPVAALADEIASTVPGLEHNSESRRRLARFALAAHAALRERAGDDLRLGRLSFPAPVERSETIR